jgi:hypothetical protein
MKKVTVSNLALKISREIRKIEEMNAGEIQITNKKIKKMDNGKWSVCFEVFIGDPDSEVVAIVQMKNKKFAEMSDGNLIVMEK